MQILNLQTQVSSVNQTDDEQLKQNLQQFTCAKIIMETSWEKCNLLGFYEVNDNKLVDGKVPQIM
jgi:putative methionine-R-sulfoxide reductase with GAF domain